MNLLINLRKIGFFTAFLMFFALFVSFSNDSMADQDDYAIENVEAGATSKSPAKAKKDTFAKARRVALGRLFEKLEVKMDANSISDRDVSDMVLQERVLDETFEGNSYSAVMNVVFSEKFVQRYLDSHYREAESEEEAKELKFLTIPVLMEEGKVIVWDEGNEWRSSLRSAIKRENAKNFRVIDGDIFNLSVINADTILRVEPKVVRELFDKYSVDFIYIAFFSYNNHDRKAKLSINGFTKRDRFHYRLSFNNADRLSDNEVKSQVASKLIEYLSTNSLARAEETSEGDDVVRLEIPVRRLEQWIYIKHQLKTNDFVTDLNVKSVSKDFVKVDIKCKDSFDLIRNFAKIGFDLTYRAQDVYLLTVKQ